MYDRRKKIPIDTIKPCRQATVVNAGMPTKEKSNVRTKAIDATKVKSVPNKKNFNE